MKSVEDYLTRLEEELIGADPAITQDALADAEEHLRNALEQAHGSGEELSEAELLPPIIEKYGTPEEIAASYREVANLTQPAFAPAKPVRGKSALSRFLSVITDARAWAALLYLLSSMMTGIVYFTWAVTGLSLSLGLLVLIIGIPFTILFLLSIRSIALVEGRIVEALLGVRMPRRPLFASREAGWMGQVKELLLEGRTWTAIAYMILQLPLGIFYFSIFLTLIVTSLAAMASPILQIMLDRPFIYLGAAANYIPEWLMPLIVVGGFILLLGTMHLAKLVARAHGSLAKLLLVGTLRTYSHKTSKLDRTSDPRRRADILDNNQEDSMERKEEIESRPETWIIILAIAAALITLGITVMAFLISS